MAEEYETPRIAVDPAIFTVSGRDLLVLLNVREKAPYSGMRELPGGLLFKGEDPSDALERKLRRLFEGRNVYFTQFRTFYAPSRDPRTRTISIGFIALVPEELIKDRSKWYGVSRLPQLAFDHKEIINEARTYLKQNINALVAKQLLPNKFPLNQLQRIYEVIEGTKYDNRNFRKKMIYDGVVEPTNQFLSDRSYRPPRLYRFKATKNQD